MLQTQTWLRHNFPRPTEKPKEMGERCVSLSSYLLLTQPTLYPRKVYDENRTGRILTNFSAEPRERDTVANPFTSAIKKQWEQ